MDIRSKNIFLVFFVIVVAFAVVAWLFVVNRENPVNTSILIPSAQNTPALPVAQPAQNQDGSQAESANTIQKLPEPPSIPGQKTNSPEILEKYGKYAFETFEKYPNLADKLRSVHPAFDTKSMYVSFPSQVYKLNNGKTYLALGGCTEHNCGGTGVFVLLSLTDEKVYLAKENTDQVDFEKYYGNPNEDEKNTMLNFFLQK